MNDPLLERYLAELEQVLRPFPVSDRAEIVTEIKSHVLSTLERDPAANLKGVLTALGDPGAVANRYLLERGLKPIKPPISPIVKWLAIGFIGCFALFLGFLTFVIIRFSPIINVDSDRNHISLLGETFEVKGTASKFMQSFLEELSGDEKNQEGSHELTNQQNVSVFFSNGHFDFLNSDSRTLSWECKNRGSRNPGTESTQNELVLDFRSLAFVSCEIYVPKDITLKVQGSNGLVTFENPHYHLDGKFTNGKIKLEPDADLSYRFELEVINGKSDFFSSAKDPESYLIAISLVNGAIEKD